jgi:hypothetical protein
MPTGEEERGREYEVNTISGLITVTGKSRS